MKLKALTAALRRRGDTLTPETPERRLFEAWARSRDTGGWERELLRSKGDPARYAVEQDNIEFEAFVLGLTAAARWVAGDREAKESADVFAAAGIMLE